MENEHSACRSRSVTPLQHISLLSSELTTKEQLSICCKPSFRLRRLKNKGAILVLIWSYLCINLPLFYRKLGVKNDVAFNVHVVTVGLTLSIAGWIADVRFGRYKVMYFSMWIMWAALMLITMSSVLATTVDGYTSKIHSYVNEALWVVVAIGFGGFQANVIQFGIDQLHDASSDEISSFIVWYVWTCSSSSYVTSLLLNCLPKYYHLLGNLIMVINLSLALSSMLMFNHWLVKEPVTQNPFKLVYSVIRYAIKHRHPEYRSAFTYCEDEPPSRIDFGKSKYGGPFTTEQVEDVKTLLQFPVVMFAGAIVFSVAVATMQHIHTMSKMLTDTSDKSISKCYSKDVFINTFTFSSVIILPVYEFFFYPLFHRCLERINTQWTLIFGAQLLTSAIVSLLVIETIARYNYLADNSYNTTIPCKGKGALNTSMDFQWMAVPLLLHSLSVGTFSIGSIKFIASQTPYSMRGLIMGVCYCIFVLCVAIGASIDIPFTRQLSIWGTGIISCGFWYAMLLLVIEVLVGFMLLALLRWYKKRKREDVLPNEHIFAERYYDRDSQ